MKACKLKNYPNVNQLIKILCTLGVTYGEIERANSILTYLKAYLRATMGHERLTGLALMHVHYSINIDLDQVVDFFTR